MGIKMNGKIRCHYTAKLDSRENLGKIEININVPLYKAGSRKSSSANYKKI
jgi:hypothetical protein